MRFWINEGWITEGLLCPPETCINYLKSVLKGIAATVISGLSISNDNYDLAIALLKERFGRSEVTIESLYAKLQSLPRSQNGYRETKNLWLYRKVTTTVGGSR